jgi:uncharacterized protein (DUF983 family)
MKYYTTVGSVRGSCPECGEQDRYIGFDNAGNNLAVRCGVCDLELAIIGSD